MKVSQDLSPSAGSVTSGQSHTPGPWEWDAGLIPPDGPGSYADIYKDGGDLIIAQFNDLIPEGRANARLIAAAPELLAALTVIANASERSGTMFGGKMSEVTRVFENITRVSRAAISKAEGK